MIRETYDFNHWADKVFFTSDLHLFHKLVLKHRNFNNFDEMHHAMITAWNSVISNNCIPYVLGDVSFGKPDATLEILNQLNGIHMNLILGNHDGKRYQKYATKKFLKIDSYGELNILNVPNETDKKKIVLFHFPILRWNKAHYGSWHLHGHSHGNLVGKELPNSYDVGVDCNNLTPISLRQIQEIMSKTPKEAFLKHHDGMD